MRVDLETIIDAPADEVWHHLQRPALLQHVAAPLLAFRSLEPPAFPERWNEGDFRVSMRLFGLLPLGPQTVGIRLGRGTDWPRTVRDDGHGPLISRWEHRISVEPEAGGGTRYRDVVDIEAGLLTPFVWAFAQLLCRHRQRRWRRLAAGGFRTLPPEMTSQPG